MSTNKVSLEEKFTKIYAQLNVKQQEAVDHIDGPVMVIAGPGTGKTQILSARIAKILLTTDALPDNILCLTYTDAGVVAMRKRLQQMIGPDAYKVNIYTFHAFCNDIIQDNLSLFEKTSLDPISDVEKIEILKKLIDDFPKNHPLKRYRGDVYYEIKNLGGLFSTMKREGWTSEFVIEKIDSYLQRIETSDEFVYKTNRAGKWAKGDKTPAYYEMLEKMENLKAATNEFANYQRFMSEKRRYDFDDMIIWVINAFQKNKNLLANYQEKYQYILVDEFQDTSGTQNKIVSLLINYWDRPNIFVVGDDDQSIFRFQGANIDNMLEFGSQFSDDLTTIILTNNYRSTQGVLDVSKALIDRNEERLTKKLNGLNKKLVSANSTVNTLKHLPNIIEYNSTTEELVGITLQVEELLKEGVPPGSIAVLYRENKFGEELSRFFKLRNTPVYSKRTINLLAQVFIKKLVTILRYLHQEHEISFSGDELFFEILHFDFYDAPPIEIAKLMVAVNAKSYKGEPTSLRQLLYEKSNTPPKDLFDNGFNEKLQNVSGVFEALIADVSNLTIQQLLDAVIKRGQLLQYIKKSANKVELMQYLSAFFDFVKEEHRRNPQLSLGGLISLLDLMEKEAVPLPFHKTVGSDSGVNLLTAHGSKGLEFEYVFIAGANASFWEKKRKPSGGYKFPDTIFSSLPSSSEEEELRRLFYVAITRAEKHLSISYAKLNAENKELEPSMFIAEILENYDLPIAKVRFSETELAAFQELLFSVDEPIIEEAEEDFINALLANFVMNVTALNNYLSCPLKFYYQNLIRIPSGKHEATEFGSAIHFSLERLFRKMKESEAKSFPPVEDLISDFNWYMDRHKESFTKEAFARRLEQGNIILPEYYNKYVASWSKVVTVETNIKGVVINHVPIKGKIDKMEFDGNEVNVVDYKTGNIDYAKNKLMPPNDKEPNGGDYWRQAVFYKLLVDNYPSKNWVAQSAEFDFIEPDAKKNFHKKKIFVTLPDIETVKQQLTSTWEKIHNKEFYTGCGKPDCYWCNFVKDNNLTIEQDMEEEG